MGRCLVKQPLDGAHAWDKFVANCFAANSAFITLELALVRLEWPFADVANLMSG